MAAQTLIVVEDAIELIDVGEQGPPGRDGTSGSSSSGTFVLDVTSAGVVGNKTYAVEPNILTSCLTDTAAVRVHVGCGGDATTYKPTITVAGVLATLTESATTRWFTGYADITVGAGISTVVAISSTGTVASVDIELLGAGPAVSSIVFGSYPGAQTELKQNDTIGVTVSTDLDATSITITGGSAVTSTTLSVTAGVATGTLTVGPGSGALTISVKARNSFGTFGDSVTSGALTLNQSIPTFGTFSVAYPVGKTALGVGDTATVTCTVSNFDSAVSGGYAASKTYTNAAASYVNSGTNYSITATRLANGTTATASTLVKIAGVAATAAITISGNPSRLTTSPAGTDYEVRITPNQVLASAPTLVASAGAWQGSWTLVGAYWARNLRVTDADPRGTATFSSLALTGLSGLAGSTISSGSTFVIGGISSRQLTFAAFSRVTAIGASVLDSTKTQASITGGNTLSRYTDNAVHANGYYIANSDGTYNPVGAYLGLSDSAFAGSNTSGTLIATFQEAA
jgi:hypothetical protein